jgi:DNA polymerase-3 subunit psi
MPNSANSSIRREQLLAQMGITQYELSRPMALRGEVAVALPAQARLVIIADPIPEINRPFFLDILRSLTLAANQIYCLTPEQAKMLPETPSLAFWLIGQTTLPESQSDHPLTLTTPELTELAADPSAKRDFWQQICRHENYFTANV